MLFAHRGDYIVSKQRYLRFVVTWAGIPFIAYYLFSYWRYYKQGYKISPQKVVLLASTAAVSIYTWGFNSFGHAFQYFGIVWWSEKKTMMSLFHLQSVSWGEWATLAHPDGGPVPGSPLKLEKAENEAVRLSWDASCDTYYLNVPVRADREGSYGTAGACGG